MVDERFCLFTIGINFSFSFLSWFSVFWIWCIGSACRAYFNKVFIDYIQSLVVFLHPFLILRPVFSLGVVRTGSSSD